MKPPCRLNHIIVDPSEINNNRRNCLRGLHKRRVSPIFEGNAIRVKNLCCYLNNVTTESRETCCLQIKNNINRSVQGISWGIDGSPPSFWRWSVIVVVVFRAGSWRRWWIPCRCVLLCLLGTSSNIVALLATTATTSSLGLRIECYYELTLLWIHLWEKRSCCCFALWFWRWHESTRWGFHGELV